MVIKFWVAQDLNKKITKEKKRRIFYEPGCASPILLVHSVKRNIFQRRMCKYTPQGNLLRAL
jgi:hypothetical protein